MTHRRCQTVVRADSSGQAEDALLQPPRAAASRQGVGSGPRPDARWRPALKVLVVVLLGLVVGLGGPGGPSTITRAGPAPAPAANGLPTISLGDISVTEGTSIRAPIPGVSPYWTFGYGNGFTVTPRLSAPSSDTVTFRLQIQFVESYGGAIPGGSTPRSGCIGDVVPFYPDVIVSFAPGETQRTIGPYGQCGDDYKETSERVLFAMSEPVNAVLERPTATVTIIDDDGLPPFGGGEHRTPEGVSAQFVPPGAPPHSTYRVEWSTRNGSATGGASCSEPGVDFIASSGVLDWGYGPIFVQFCQETIYEPDESFQVVYANPSWNIQLDGPTTVTIVNDDPPPPPCNIRPNVQLQTRALSPGRLEVTVRSTMSPGTTSNPLRSLRFDRLDNARVEIAGYPASAQPFEAQLPNTPTEAVFVVNRVAAGAVTVHFTVQDACGSWPTFVGGGASGF